MSTAPKWPDELVEKLRKLAAQGLAPSEIAQRLGLGRNAVIGKLHRLNMYTSTEAANRARSKALKKIHAEMRARRNEHRLAKLREAIKTRRPKKAKPAPVRLPVIPCRAGLRDGRGLALLDVTPTRSIEQLGRNHCRAIGNRPELITLETPLYCGEVTDGGSWCEAHKAIVFSRWRDSGGGRAAPG